MLPDLRVEMLPTAALAPYAANARQHPEEQVRQLAASIREFGFNVPVLVDDAGVLIAGHGRVLAAKALGLASIPAIRLGHLTEAQARAYRLADNQLALNSTWDEGLLAGELRGLLDAEFDLGLIGFDAVTLDRLLADQTEGLTDPDETPAVQAAAVTEPGDVWLLGKHRIVCGDCTDPLVVEKALNGVKPHLMVTDPPYGVEYKPNWRNEAARNSTGMGNRALGAGAVGEVLNDDRADWREAWALFPGDVAYVWHAGVHTRTVIDSLEVAGFQMRSQIIWSKSNFAIGRGDYHWQHEPCWYAVRKGRKGHWNGDRKQTTVWQIPKPARSETGHGTQKPVECMQRPIENNSSPGQAVYEPFSGSGTTIIAAEMTGRAAHAIELNPLYVDVAVRRWQQFTGKAAVLAGEDRTFDDIAAARGVRAAA